MSLSTTLKAFFPHFPPVVLAPTHSLLLDWADRQRQRAALARLDDRLLDDIGVSRHAAAEEVRQWN